MAMPGPVGGSHIPELLPAVAIVRADGLLTDCDVRSKGVERTRGSRGGDPTLVAYPSFVYEACVPPFMKKRKTTSMRTLLTQMQMQSIALTSR